MPLYLAEDDVAALLDPAGALPVLEACCRRMAAGAVESMPRRRLLATEGSLSVLAAADAALGYAGVEGGVAVAGRESVAVTLFSLETGALEAVIETDLVRQVATGAASGVAARYLAREGAASVGVIGCGRLAESQLVALRAAVPSVDEAVAWCRTPDRLRAFCDRTGAVPAESSQEAAACDVVVTATTSRDPVLRGDWLRPGALVCAVGANRPARRELDNGVLGRATFVCCDSLEQSRIEAADLIEPVASGALDWLEVHELQEVVVGAVEGRSDPADIAVFKSNGLAAWDVAVAAELVRRARERGLGRER